LSENQNSELERRLSGKTLQVYLYLQKKRQPSGIREVQRDLELSSPSVVEYHVEKLVEMELARRDSYGRVVVTRKVRVKAMASYVNIGSITVPRFAFYASFFTLITAFYAVFNLNSMSIYGVAVPGGAAAIFWLEAAKLWKHNLLEKSTKKQGEKDYFWISLMPGLAALAVFMAASIFLFYYVEPNLAANPSPPIDPNAPSFQPRINNPLVVDDFDDLPIQKHTGDIALLGFTPIHVTILLLAGGLVAGFIIYLLVRYRCNNSSVLTLERDWN
jgi:SOS-response transcriptional repressor LexA